MEIWNSYEYQFDVKIWKLWKTWQYSNLGIIHRTIKSAGRRYTVSLLVNYTGNPELCSFCCSMLHPNNACRKHLILSFYRRKKNSAIRRQWSPAKDLPQLQKLANYEHLALSKTKKQTQVAAGLHYPCALCCCHGKHIESTVPTDSQVMTKNKTFPLNHSLACASYAIYLATYTCISNDGRKNRKSNDDEKGG